MRDSVRTVLEQAITAADQAVAAAREGQRREARRVREAGLSKQAAQLDPDLAAANRDLLRALYFAEGVRSLANRLLAEVLGEQPVPHPEEEGTH